MINFNGKYGLINKKGQIVLPAIYDNIEIFDAYSKKLARIEQNGKYGFINRKFERESPCYKFNSKQKITS